MSGSRDALLDAIAISTRNVAELERKQRAYLVYRDRVDQGRWLFAHGMNAAFQIDYACWGCLHPRSSD